MNEIIDQNAIENLYMLFVFATALAFFWILESVWANDKRWLPAIIILPATIFIFILNYWEETRFRCFIATLLFFYNLCNQWFGRLRLPCRNKQTIIESSVLAILYV